MIITRINPSTKTLKRNDPNTVRILFMTKFMNKTIQYKRNLNIKLNKVLEVHTFKNNFKNNTMKNLFLTLSIILISTAALAQTSSDVIRLSEPVQATESYEVFGAEIDVESLDPISLTELINGEEAEEITLLTSVSEVCAKKGCFFIAQDGDLTARITFKDYGFFIPTDSQGKEVILVGDFSVETLTEEKAKHYAEDAGQDASEIKGEQKEYSIVATSIVVPKSK